MLILLLDLLRSIMREDADLGPLRVLTFISVRAALSLGMAFVISLIVGPWLIERLRLLKAHQSIRTAARGGHAIDFAEMHGHKRNTPTMGGLLILFSLLVPVLLLCRLTSGYVIVLIMVTLGYALLGFWDDYLKIVERNHHGVSPVGKLLVQGALGLAMGCTLYFGDWGVYYQTTDATGYPYILMPFFKYLYIPVGILFIPFVMFVLTASSNAVNLTDGLDGLAIGVSIANIAAFTIVAYLVSRVDFSSYLFVPHVRGGGEIVVFLSALLGASLGFLWFNSHPAEVFMGDTGSMLLGGALGATALLLKQEMLLVVIGGVFVAEAVSVILQVGCFKLTGTRVFLMSPLHHHFERAGQHESKIIIRFWMVSWLLAMAGLAMLKLR